MKKHLLLLVLCLTAVGAWAQETTVSSELTGKCVTIGTAATEVAVDKWYVLHNHNRNGCVSEETTAFKIRETPQGTFIASRIAGKLFKITASATEGQYYIVSGNGKYFDFESNDASTVSDDPVS